TGLHPSALPERTVREEACDYIGEGEGFYTLTGLLGEDKFSKIPGLWYGKGRSILHNKRAANIQNLDGELPNVAWDLLPLNEGKYKAHNWHSFHDLNSRLNYASISTSLSCPFSCSFCCIQAPFGEHSYRMWSPDWALRQIDILAKKFDIKNLKVIDELFVFDPKHFLPIADGLVERDYGLNIWAYARVDTTKEKHLPILKKAGFNWLAIGIESGNEMVRREVSKGKFAEENIRSIVRKIKDAGISINANYIFGLPSDTAKSMQQTLNLATDLNCEYANFYSAMAYPGSKLYQEALEKGWKLPDSWIGYSQHSYECQPLPTNTLSAADVLRFRDNAFNTYYAGPAYLNMLEAKFGPAAKAHIADVTKIKLKRQLLGD
ncbi:MAG: radical SAM protein, partial [DPANN group archaeon]|nr:radical SAM protein [DPANN group archaeon]